MNDVRPLDVAGRGDIAFLDNPKYLSQFAEDESGRVPRFPQIR